MNTVRDKLIETATTQAERDLIDLWMSPRHDDLCARQRAWERVQARGNPARIQFSW